MTESRPDHANARQLRKSDPRVLVTLMSLAGDEPAKFSTEELEAIWRHQRKAPLRFDLAEASQQTVAATLVEVTRVDRRPLESFADLLDHPNPPLALLQWTKDFAKSHAAGADQAFPPDIASVLYYAAIALARVRCDRRITELGDAELSRGLSWAINRLWLDDATRAVLSQTLGEIAGADA